MIAKTLHMPMQLTYNGSIPLVDFLAVKLQAHFQLNNTEPPLHSHLGLEFINRETKSLLGKGLDKLGDKSKAQLIRTSC